MVLIHRFFTVLSTYDCTYNLEPYYGTGGAYKRVISAIMIG